MQTQQHISPSVAVLGLGIIGGTWARNLSADGLLAAAWNRTPIAGFPCWKDTPAKAVVAARVCIICVADPAAVDSVIAQAAPVLSPAHIIVQTSTIDPISSARAAAAVRKTGARYVECPFTGSRPAAEARKTVFYQGGDPAILAEVEPVLARISQTRLHVGTEGQACAVKLAMNLQLAMQCEALCESLRFARAAGVSDAIFFECLSRNIARSGLTDLKEPKLRSGDYAPQFSAKHMHKDLRLALSSADAGSLPVIATLEKQFAAVSDKGCADEDFCALYKALP